MSKNNRNNRPNQQAQVDANPNAKDKKDAPGKVDKDKQANLENAIVKEAVELAHHRINNIVKLSNMALEWETLSTN